MTDHEKMIMAGVFIGSGLLFSALGLVMGWLIVDFKNGLLLGFINSIVYIIFALISALSVQKPTGWMLILLYTAGVAYTILPDLMPGGVDDAFVMTLVGAITYVLWKRMSGAADQRVLALLLIAGVYPLIGGFIPLPFDEILVFGSCVGLAYGLSQRKNQNENAT